MCYIVAYLNLVPVLILYFIMDSVIYVQCLYSEPADTLQLNVFWCL
jgi:hypothetical protein